MAELFIAEHGDQIILADTVDGEALVEGGGYPGHGRAG